MGTYYHIDRKGKYYLVVNSSTSAIQSAWLNELDARDAARRLNKITKG